ncbi:MAG: SDR family NAD(P)-dependent oxidoreductase, partial [Rhodospirillales bacterium]|nr:SDR family NAD(P)-dependent oxidoreductase [Rhodospirillales bacterium]
MINKKVGLIMEAKANGTMCDLRGRTALVTGGSRGIGRAISLCLAETGADVVVNYRQTADKARETCDAARQFGVRAEAYQGDVANEEEAAAMVERVQQEVGRIDILVNNAGITRDRSFLKMTRMMWDEVLGVNLNGAFNMTHAVLPEMVKAEWGRIVNIASIVGQTGNFGQANYAVTKGGLISFTMSLAREVARKGVTVNAVAPGFIETDMTAAVPEVALDTVKSMTPIGRLG